MNTPPHHGSDILSPNVPTPRSEWPQQPDNSDRAGNLLNLLRFSNGPGQAAAQPAPAPAPAPAPEQPRSPPVQGPTSPHGRNISASDLVASLFGKQPAAAAQAAPAPPAVPSTQPEGPSENTQEMLLRLLNRGASAAEAPALVQATQPTAPQDITIEPKETTVEVVEATPKGPAKPETVASPTPKESMFTYVNPFDQLAAASPRSKSPQPKPGDLTPEVEVTQKHKINVTADVEAPTASQLMGLPKRAKTPVLEKDQREAVNEVVGRLVDEIGRSLSGSEAKPTVELETEAPAVKEGTEAVLSSIATHLRESAGEAKEAPKVEEPEVPVKADVETTAAPVAQAVQDTAEALADSWESAEDSAEKEEERIVPVHTFPMQPFISIVVKAQTGKLATFRDDGIMDIARLKKEFDQLDRSLTAATPEYIVYALAKTGGIRIIRQDDGSDRQVFRSTRDRVFNVALCASPSATGHSDVQAILGIGVSGTVYWALVSRSGKDLFELDALESESLIFPPFPASDENTSGGQLKTRAKRSSRHPDLFAIGRGKNIYVVSPQAAMNASYGVTGSHRTVNTEKFFKERALKISTGKAGKDFAFSDDDTVIASLDKTGRLRFWELNGVLDKAALTDGAAPSEVRVPLSTFVTGSPAEKSWPTSVLFLDKHRAYTKSMALRYVLVGLKQNHTLQLWDIGLGKAVEELKFPHENESDAICSVAYHAPSGIIVVGHPTRNTIYFVHLSAPRYNLPSMTQAEFIKAASGKDDGLPKPESTACMSGIREISLGSKGQLRSLELLPITKSASEKRGTEDIGLFELYVMHSRGVTCLNIKWEDLGLTSEQKVIRSVDALKEGSIEIGDLQTFPTYVTDEPSVNGDTSSIPSRATTAKEAVKKVDALEATVPSRNTSPTKISKKKVPEEQGEAVPTPSGAEKPEKKKKKKATTSDATVKAKDPSATAGAEPLPTKDLYKEGENLASSLATISATQTAERSIPAGLVSNLPNNGTSDNALGNMQSSTSAEFIKTLRGELEELNRRFDDERRSWDAASSAKQDQVLRLVSSTLSDNVEKNLGRIVSQSIQNDVLPAVNDATTDAVNTQLQGSLSRLGISLNDELRQTLPRALGGALQHPAVMNAISESVSQRLAPYLESEVAKAVQSSVAPLLDGITRHTKKVESDMERYFKAQLQHYESQRQNDHAKLEEMTTMLHGLSKTVASLAATQNRPTEYALPKRGSMDKVPAENVARAPPQPIPQQTQSRPQSIPPQQPAAPAPRAAPSTPEEAELAEISGLMSAGQFEAATIKWLQSSQQADLFDNFFVRVSPEFLTRLSAIVMLSVGVAVTSSLQTNVGQRLAWLNVVLNNVNPVVCVISENLSRSNPHINRFQDPDLREVAPQIMDILNQRLNSLYMSVVERNPHDQILRMIAPLSRRARELNSIAV